MMKTLPKSDVILVSSRQGSNSHPGLAMLFDYHNKKLALHNFRVSPKVVEHGQPLNISCRLINNNKMPVDLVVEYRVQYKYGTKLAGPHIIQSDSIRLAGMEVLEIKKTCIVGLFEKNDDKRSGECKVDICVNGIAIGSASYYLTA